MRKFCKYTCLMITFIGLHSCFSEKYEYKGEKKIINKEDWRIKLYQLDKFEMLTPVDYEIVNENDSIILGRHRLTGAENLQDVDKFYAKIQDSIFYVCYPYPEVVAIKHISNLNGSNQWELIKKLQKHDAFLYLFDGYVVDKYLDSLNQKVQPSAGAGKK